MLCSFSPHRCNEGLVLMWRWVKKDLPFTLIFICIHTQIEDVLHRCSRRPSNPKNTDDCCFIRKFTLPQKLSVAFLRPETHLIMPDTNIKVDTEEAEYLDIEKKSSPSLCQDVAWGSSLVVAKNLKTRTKFCAALSVIYYIWIYNTIRNLDMKCFHVLSFFFNSLWFSVKKAKTSLKFLHPESLKLWTCTLCCRSFVLNWFQV